MTAHATRNDESDCEDQAGRISTMRLGVDVGGTFTDLLLHDEATQRTFEAKTPSTPEDQSIGVAAGVKLICEKAGISPKDISVILHGTTVATNAVLEGKGARVGLLATEGFEYTLHLAKSWTPGPLFGWIVMDKPDPLASLADTRGIPERMNARGEVVKALDVAKATALIDEVCGSNIEALTISLMHSYANPLHERQLGEIVKARYPNIPVSLSSDILPEFREYDRAITTVMNDYVRPIMKRYLTRIEDRLRAEGVTARLHIVRSDGGLMSAEAASERPVYTVLSGPAGGVTSTAMVARRSGFPRLLAFDMGGTSTDVSVIIDGQPTISRSTEVGMFPAKVPTLDVRSVGAGGGSIAEVSELTGSLRVGPRSAGARPGPVSYGRGGTEPAVSDANVVLGYLPPVLLGGDMTLDVEGARAAVGKIGGLIGLSPEDAAKGIIDIANEVMLGALRVITVQRGLDPRDFGILAFGGAGPLHANALAELLGCYPVVVPPNPGVLSALGFLESAFKNEFVQTYIRSTQGLDPNLIWSRFAGLGEKAKVWLVEQEVAEADRSIVYSMDLRYEQQGFEVSVDVAPDVVARAGGIEPILAEFHKLHERLYGVRFHVPVELVALRVVAVGATPPVNEQAPTALRGDPKAAVIETRPAYFDGRWIDTPNYDRALLGVGARVAGPAIIRQYDTTTVLLPDHFAEVDAHGNLLIWPNSKGN
jgi:N-methylhydantoinase A